MSAVCRGQGPGHVDHRVVIFYIIPVIAQLSQTLALVEFKNLIWFIVYIKVSEYSICII